MNFLVDAQLPPALARWLTDIGHTSQHVVDIDLAASPDTFIWRHALENDLIILSKDEDFAVRHTMAESGPPVVWIRFGNCGRSEMLRRFESALPAILASLNRGERLVEVC